MAARFPNDPGVATPPRKAIKGAYGAAARAGHSLAAAKLAADLCARIARHLPELAPAAARAKATVDALTRESSNV